MNEGDGKPEEIVVETDEGQVVGHSTQVDDFPQDIVPVSEEELDQFAKWAREAASFVQVYGAAEEGSELQQFDEAFQAWQNSATRRHTDEQVISLLGAYLGERLVEDFEMEWVLVSDQYGRDYAVRHKTSELMSFPFSSVMKRIEDQEHGFIHGVYHFLKHELEHGQWKERADVE